MKRRFLIFLLPVMLLASQSAAALDCPADKECIPPEYTQWCHDLGQHYCGTLGETNLCEENTSLGFLGGRSYEHQLAVDIRGQLCVGAGYTSGEPVGPSSQEIFMDTPDQPTIKQQYWDALYGYPSLPNGHLVSYQLQATRQLKCPEGWLKSWTTINGQDEYRCERDRIPCCDANPTTPQPVLPFAQEKRLTAADFNGGGGLEFVRHYNSQSRHSGDVQSNSLLGPRWSTNWESRLEEFDADTLRIIRPDGTQVQFALSGGIWSAWTGEPATLTAVPGALPGSAAWLFRDRQDRLEAFTANGALLYVEYIDGRHFDLQYDADGRLQRVTARDGRYLQFVWNTIYDGAYPRFKRVTKVQFPDGSEVNYTYETAYGRLVSAFDPVSIRATYLYNEAANTSYAGFDKYYLLTGIVDPNGHRYSTYQYDATAKVSESGLAGGASVSTFALGSNYVDITSSIGIERRVFSLLAGAQRVTEVKLRPVVADPLIPERTRTYTYDPNGYKDVVTDFKGTVTDYDFNARGLEESRIEAKGKDTQLANAVSEERKIVTSWHAGFRVPTERSIYRCPAPSTTQSQPCSGAGGSNLWELESLSRYAYNTRGQVTARCEVDPLDTTAMAYTCGSSTNAPAGVRQTLTSYCEAGDLNATGSTCALLGLVKSVNGPRTDVSDVTGYAYYMADHSSCTSAPTSCPYRKGDLWKVTNALGQITEYVSYDGAGRVTRIKDANSVLTDLAYHARGWLQSRTVRANANGTPNAAEDATTTLTYDNVGQVTRITQPDGAYIDYTYDDAHRLTDITDSLGSKISYTLDAAGNRTAENTRDPSNTLTRTLGRVYDSLGRLQTLLNAQNEQTVFTYDANGNQDTVTDALTRVTNSDVDPLNRLIQSTDALMGQTKYRYDARDNLVEVIDAKTLGTTYTYDRLNNLTLLDSPDTGITSYLYDSAGNRISQTDARGVTSTYSYDALNRLTGIAYPTSSNNVAFAYDQVHVECESGELSGVGRLTGFTDPSGSTKLCYDLRGNVKRKIAVVNGNPLVTRWSYSVADRIVQMVYPSELQVDYGRDALGRIFTIDVTPGGGGSEALITSVTYYPFGPVKEITWGNGSTSTRTYDQNYWIDSIDSSQADGLDLDFTLDEVGNIVGLSDAVPGGPTPDNVYAYDELYRLQDVNAPGADIEAYTYDAIGNRLSKTVGAGLPEVYAYPSNSHRLSSTPSTDRDYDDNGNTTTFHQYIQWTPTLEYSERNRFSAYKNGLGLVTHGYAYNARGERVYKDDTDQPKANSRSFGYDESGRLLLEANRDGKALQEFIWLDDLPVGVYASQTLHYIQPDHLGSPRKVIDTRFDGAIWDWPILNNPFGEAAPNQDPDGDSTDFVLNLRFPGQYFDVETGLHYNYFRDYEPGTGRYVESDPIGLDGGISTYGYVSANPYGGLDPLGLWQDTETSWCRQNPQHCGTAAAAGAAGAAGLGAAALANINTGTSVPAEEQCCSDYTNVYESNPKHRKTRYRGKNGVDIAREPTNGPAALAASVPVDSSGRRRVGFDPTNGELVVLPMTREDNVNCVRFYHGWVVDYMSDLRGRNDILNAIKGAGYSTPRF